MSKALFEELYNDFYKLSLRNGRDNEEDILEGYLIDTIRKYPIETFGFKGVSDLWESNFISHESYFLDKLMNLSTGRNLRIETNIRPHERIKSSGTKKREIQAFADAIVKKIRAEGELLPESTIRKFRIVQTEGNRQVARTVEFYNLEVIIAVGYRVRSHRGTQFRQWATEHLKEYMALRHFMRLDVVRLRSKNPKSVEKSGSYSN